VSLVERTLQKMQQAGRAAAADKPAKVATPAAESARAPTPPVVTAPERSTRPFQKPTATANFDREELRRLNLLPPLSLERRLAGQFQIIKRPLVAAAQGHVESNGASGAAVMVASALPGEGKTFTSLNLALSLALEKDIEVLLVDADVRKPHVSRLLGVGGEPGLLELLSDEQLHPDAVILGSNVPGLSVLPAGRPIDTATELLSSKRMRELVNLLAPAGGRRVVLFDSPPLLLATESHALSTHMGQIVLVVRADVTPQKAVLQAIDSLGEGKQVGLVLNQSNTAADVNYYGYGDYGDAPKKADAG
jgi:protein-tyrosine kinase